jgi:hypothetical protein
MRITKPTVVASLFFFAISALAILEGFRIKKGLNLLDYFQPLRPDNYIQSLGVIIMFVTIIFIIKELFLTHIHQIANESTKLWEIGKTMIIFMSYVGTMQWLGYLLSTILFYFIFLRWVGKYSYLKTVIISVAITACYFAFVRCFYILVPAGVIGL